MGEGRGARMGEGRGAWARIGGSRESEGVRVPDYLFIYIEDGSGLVGWAQFIKAVGVKMFALVNDLTRRAF